MSTTERMDVERVARTPDEIKETRRELAISTRTGVLVPTDLAQALEFAQNMAKAETAVPKHLRGSPGACLAIIEYAGSWEMAPYGVANKSYVVNDRLCFESQLIHAVIKKRGDLKYPKLGLETEYTGEGPTRQVRIFAECYIDDERTETRVLEIKTPMFKDISPQNSPLWKTNPDQQFFYRGALLWQRRHKPELLLGIYAKDEMEDLPEAERAAMARDVTPPRGTGLIDRLAGRNHGEGFQAANVDNMKGDAAPTPADELANIAADVPETAPPAQQVEAAAADRLPAGTVIGEGTPVGPAEPIGNPPTDPTPSPSKQAPAPTEPSAADVKDVPGYIAYLAGWLPRCDDEAKADSRFADEKADRTRCGVIGDDMQTCRTMLRAHLKQLGGC